MTEAQLLNSKTALVGFLQKRVEQESLINFLCGTYPKNVRRTAGLQNSQIKAVLNTGLPSDILVNRPDIRQAEMELLASKADVKAARLAFFPALNINSFVGLQSFNALLLLEAPASLAYNAVGGLTAPLLNRRRLKAELMNAKAEQKSAYVNYEKNVVNGFMEVYNAINDISNTKQMLELKSEEVKILKQSALTSAELFKANRASYYEVILAQKNALQSQLELIAFQKRQNLATINLYRSLGGGWQ
jgi:outer membrane protein TolC